MLIYLVEDDQSILELEEYALQAQGFETQGFGEGDEHTDARSYRTPESLSVRSAPASCRMLHRNAS